ncbi:unnamed protein product [Somion occarium]|uniref:PH domain-containing protein n=1 Tax=Somion occarium TaxID=3059160 RepID=A0ABP1CYQ8_9APHY
MSRIRSDVQSARTSGRAHSVLEVSSQSSGILVRTSRFLKKVSNIRGSRKKTTNDVNDSTHDAAAFAARSMGLGRKSFGFSQPVLGVHTSEMANGRVLCDTEDDSDGSPRSSNAHVSSSRLRLFVNKSQLPQGSDTASPSSGGPSVSTTTSSQPSSSNTTPSPPSNASSSPPSLPPTHRSTSSWSRLFGDRSQSSAKASAPRAGRSHSTAPSIASNPQATLATIPDSALPNGIPRSSSPSPARVGPAPDGLPRSSEPSWVPDPTKHAPLSSPEIVQDIAPSTSSGPGTTAVPSSSLSNDVPGLSEHVVRPSGVLSGEPPPRESHAAPVPSSPSGILSGDDRVSVVMDTRSQSLPSRHIVLPAAATPSSPLVASTSPSSTSDEAIPRVDQKRDKSLHLRLASLPPPMMARYTAQGSTRLTPSVIPRPTPMPILNLPVLHLPVSAPSQPQDDRGGGAPLRSMPALPLTGPRDDENPDMDEEGSDSSDDDDEAQNSLNREEGGSDDDDIDGDDCTPANRSRIELPRMVTSPFSISFGPKSASRTPKAERPLTLYFTPTGEAQPTPLAGPSSQPLDYFSVPKQEAEPGLKTPRPVDFSISKPRVDVGPSKEGPGGPGMIPRIVPMPPTPTSPKGRRPPRITRPSTGTGPSEVSRSSRPSLYQHGSRSMIDLVSHTWQEENSSEPRSARLEAIPSDVAVQAKASEVQSAPTPTLRRQRSLPMYQPDSEPPPYPSFFQNHRQHIIQPREEEGREPLPVYSNSVFMMGMMPRKMEFVAPGVQAKERKWRRVIVVLEGTVMRIYRTHGAGIAGKGGKVGEWWERTVGASDWSTSDGVGGLTGSQGGIRVSAIRDRERRLQLQNPLPTDSSPLKPKGEEHEAEEPRQQQPSPTRLRFQLAANLLHPSRSSNLHSSNSSPNASRSGLAVPSASTRSRLSFDIPRERAEDPPPSGRRSMDALRSTPSSSSRNLAEGESFGASSSRSAMNGSSRTSSILDIASSASSMSRSSSTTAKNSISSSDPNQLNLPDARDLVRSYTLQHAESGLASDYTKRRNVIRIRMEGEQFLLQARDVASVIDWIEAIQAATNIALDLDERPMPKGPLFPRRRRRRGRRPGTAGQDTGQSRDLGHAPTSS